jgi:hypothetical protein
MDTMDEEVVDEESDSGNSSDEMFSEENNLDGFSFTCSC